MASLTKIVGLFTNQKALIWPKIGSDGYGKPMFGAPTVTAVFWQDVQAEVLLPDGRKVLTRGLVLLASPVTPGSLMFLGDGVNPTAGWQTLPNYPALPTATQGSAEVLKVNATPGVAIHLQGVAYEAYLI